jgi:superfamily II DNA/RNA helicase
VHSIRFVHGFSRPGRELPDAGARGSFSCIPGVLGVPVEFLDACRFKEVAMTRKARSDSGKHRIRSGVSGGVASGRASRGHEAGATPRGGRKRVSRGALTRPSAARTQEFALPVTATPALPAVHAFADLDMPAPLVAALKANRLTVPFPIQGATLPNSLAGRDVLGRGRTGSGKTLAFGLALLARIAGRRAEPKQPSAIVLVPTRELAQQVTDALAPYARSLRLRLAAVVGGMPIGRQTRTLRDGVDIVIATPGRLNDLVERGDCRLDKVAVTVLDEADQMTDRGFMPQVTKLLDHVPSHGQRLLFSATLDRNVDLLVRRYLHDPVVHSVDPPAGAVTTMQHHILHVRDADKHAATTHIAARDGRVLMFLDTKRAVDKLTRHLLQSGVRAAALHAGKSQPQRTRTLDHFKSGHVSVLVATNVAARGIHVDNLDLVVNVDPPTDPKAYLHRGGRTARAGESGTVVTLVLPAQRRDISRLMADAGITPTTAQVRSGDPELARITGARPPSGIPVAIGSPPAIGASREPRRPRRHSAARRASSRAVPGTRRRAS